MWFSGGLLCGQVYCVGGCICVCMFSEEVISFCLLCWRRFDSDGCEMLSLVVSFLVVVCCGFLQQLCEMVSVSVFCWWLVRLFVGLLDVDFFDVMDMRFSEMLWVLQFFWNLLNFLYFLNIFVLCQLLVVMIVGLICVFLKFGLNVFEIDFVSLMVSLQMFLLVVFLIVLVVMILLCVRRLVLVMLFFCLNCMVNICMFGCRQSV